MANLGARHLSSAAVGELQRKSNFVIDIPGIDANITLLVKNFPLPKSANEVITVKYGNSEVKFAGHATFDGGDMTIYDSVDKDTEMNIQKWRELVYNPITESIGRASTYKKDVIVTELSPDGATQRQWKLEGVWPSAFTPGDLSNDDSGLKEISVTLTYDRGYRI